MILNNAADIQRGAVPTESVYKGAFLVWQRQHGYDTTKIAVVLLDSAGNPTANVRYFSTLDDADAACNRGKTGLTDQYMVVIGADAGITSIPQDQFVYWYGNTRTRANENTCLRKIVIPPSVRTIGDGAFYRCTYLDTVMIAAGMTEIQGDAFAYTQRLQTIDLPNSLSSISGFDYSNLHGIDFPLTVQDIKGFTNCNLLSSINIKNGADKVLTDFYLANATNYSRGYDLDITIPASVTKSIGIRAYAKTIDFQTNFIESDPSIITYIESPIATKILCPSTIKCRQLYIGSSFYNKYATISDGNLRLPTTIIKSDTRKVYLRIGGIKNITSITIPSCSDYSEVTVRDMQQLQTIYANAAQGAYNLTVYNCPNAQIVWN